PEEAPDLSIQAEKPFTDANGEEYLVRLLFTGPLGRAQWSLTTNTGLDTQKTLLLLTTGRPPSELRQQLPGEGSGSGNATDAGAKEATAQFFRQTVSDPVRRLLHLDQLSIYLGPDSVDVKERKRLADRPRFDLLGLQSFGILNRSTYEGRGELKLHDYLFLDG